MIVINIYKFFVRQKRKVFSIINRASLNKAIKEHDIFLVSYPRSGATWLSFMLACLIYPEEKKKITLKNLRDYVPDINYLYFGVKFGNIDTAIPKWLKSPRILFVHAAFNSKFPKVICLVRNPKDAIVSYWHFKKGLQPDYNLSLKKFIRKRKVWPLNWDNHVESWLTKRNQDNFKLIKYEDLTRKPKKVLVDLAKFIGVKTDKELINDAIALSEFKRMKSLERKYGVRGLKEKRDSVFIRKGKIGANKEELDKEDILYLNKRYGRTMKKLGYL